jgi:glycerol-3-phosphate dehydrogenase
MRAYPNRIKQIGFLASLGPNAPFGRTLGTLGTLFYWAIGLFGTLPPRSYSARRAKILEPNLITGRKAVKYFDAELPDNDSRFVYDFISQAVSKGAVARNYTELIGAHFDQSWSLILQSGNKQETVTAGTVINAAGPFAAEIARMLGAQTKSHLVFSKGVHFVINRRLTSQNQVLALWDEQGRLFYVLPMGDRSMIGTTDTRVESPITEVTDEDITFVLRQINNQLELSEPITPSQIVSARCGVRPLVVDNSSQGSTEDWHQLSRKHVIEGNKERKVVTILGGKLTDCLNVGEELIGELNRFGQKVRVPGRWFGEGSQLRKSEFFSLVKERASSGSREIAEGMWRRHGENAFAIIGDQSLTDLFPGLGITAQEVRHIAKTEHVVTQEDLLRRRLPISMSRSQSEIEQNRELQALFVELGL